MSTAGQKPKEKTPAEKFAELTRDIDWQRASFLNYCLRITESPVTNQSPEEVVVKKILGGYLTLAMLYFNQFRDDLKKQYIKQSPVINEMNVKLNMQAALDKLLVEWHRVYAIIVAIRVREETGESKQLVDQMSPFVDAAMRDVGLSREKFPVILQFGQSYSLRFSRYSDGFAALGIPLWVLASPWEWTILWHELAGEKVRALENDKNISFESMFDDIMKELKKGKLDALNFGWSVNWLEELFEDSFSVLHFPIHFLFVFKNLLERYPDSGQGQRHPPRSIRLATAMCLNLKLKKFEELPEDMQDRDSITWTKWVELRDEDEPERFAEFDPNTQLPDKFNVRAVWLVAEKIINWHRLNKIDKDQDNGYQKIIRNAIIEYSRGADRVKTIDLAIGGITRLNNSLKTKDPVADRQGIIDQSFSAIRDLIASGNLANLSKADKEKMRLALEAHPQVKKLLDGLGYNELLNLSFSDVDHFSESTDILLQLHDTGKSKFFGNKFEWSSATWKRLDDGKPILVSDIRIDEIDFKELKDRNKVKVLNTYKVNFTSWTSWNKHLYTS